MTAKLKLPVSLTPEAKSLLLMLLNRNPSKRLGSGKEDADEIKRHSWFKGVDWVEVYNRKLRPPKPLIKEVPELKMSPLLFVDNDVDQNRISNWSFRANNIA